jgi:hypothetical protein
MEREWTHKGRFLNFSLYARNRRIFARYARIIFHFIREPTSLMASGKADVERLENISDVVRHHAVLCDSEK